MSKMKLFFSGIESDPDFNPPSVFGACDAMSSFYFASKGKKVNKRFKRILKQAKRGRKRNEAK